MMTAVPALDEVLRQSLAGAGESALMAATELGRQMVRDEVLPEEAVAEWVRAFQAQSGLNPDLLQRGCTPLVELMMGYSLAFREQIETRRDDEQRHLRAIAEQCADGVLVCDATGTVHYANRAMATLLLPLELQAPCALPEAWRAGSADEDGAPPLAQRVLGAAREGTPWRGDHLLAPDRCLDVNLFPIRDRLQRVAGCAVFVRDVSHTRQLERQARQSERLEAVGTLAAGIAHDFNNLVGALLGFAEIGLAGADDPAVARAAFEQTEIIGLRARSLVQQITAFGRPPAMQPQRAALADVVRESLRLFDAYRPPGVSVHTELPAAPVWVPADATGLQQVLLNLFNNACHAMSWAQGRLQLTLAPLHDAAARAALPALQGQASDAPAWRLSVTDSGCGMAPEVATRVFDPFFTTRDVDQGTGLGLSTAYGLVRAAGGVITVQSTRGVGSVFHIDLPQASSA